MSTAAHIAHLCKTVDAVGVAGRWTPGRKACLVELIRRRVITASEACAKYQISTAELESWIVRSTVHGQQGLAVTKLQEIPRG